MGRKEFDDRILNYLDPLREYRSPLEEARSQGFRDGWYACLQHDRLNVEDDAERALAGLSVSWHTRDRTNLYARAEHLWGKEAQCMMLLEELGELVQSMSKYLNNRYEDSVAIKREISQEMADVQIMMEQVQRILFIGGHVWSDKKAKLARLFNKVRSCESRGGES